jgi:uncharacterized membrane protein
MKEEDFKKSLKEHLIVKAPKDFSANVMEAIALEANKKSLNYTWPGKRLLFFILLIFASGISWSFMANAKEDAMLVFLSDHVSLSLPKFHSLSLLFNQTNSYLMMGFLLFLLIEIINFTSKKHRISQV